MAMITEFKKNDERVTLHWGYWHLARFQEAMTAEYEAAGEEVPENIFKNAFTPGYTFRSEHTFTDESDGEVLEIVPGDMFAWWWS